MVFPVESYAKLKRINCQNYWISICCAISVLFLNYFFQNVLNFITLLMTVLMYSVVSEV